MGWLFREGLGSKKEAAEWALEGFKSRVIASAVKGNQLWFVAEINQEVFGPRERFIGLILLSKKNGMWGKKWMEEVMHPYFYGCPVSYLEMAHQQSAEWRAGVKKFNERAKRVFELGQQVELPNCKPSKFRVVSVKPLKGVDESGRLWRLPKARVA